MIAGGLAVRGINRLMLAFKRLIEARRNISTQLNHNAHLLERILELVKEG